MVEILEVLYMNVGMVTIAIFLNIVGLMVLIYHAIMVRRWHRSNRELLNQILLYAQKVRRLNNVVEEEAEGNQAERRSN